MSIENLENDVEQLRRKWESLKAQAADAFLSYQSKRTELIQRTAAYKVGQRLIVRGKFTYEITRLAPTSGTGRPREYEVFGRKVLKSGALHANEKELYSWDLERSQPA